MCSPTHNVYFDVIPATPTNSLTVSSPSLGYISTINLIWGFFASKISRFFLHHNVPFHLLQHFIRGNSWYLFPKHWNWQNATPTRHLNFHFTSLAVSYELFPRQVIFFSVEPNNILQFYLEKSLCVTSGKIDASGHYVVSSPGPNFSRAPCGLGEEVKDKWFSSQSNPTIYSSSAWKKSLCVTSRKIDASSQYVVSSPDQIFRSRLVDSAKNRVGTLLLQKLGQVYIQRSVIVLITLSTTSSIFFGAKNLQAGYLWWRIT